ncbi:MAG: 16S rRNA (guanine(527)-N(7))-methyltransferase RsmG [Anaerolineales bacterium]|nr:16S rRNA (guanine(527)-N(7))-methyltransferase RsmG [Anaerolineales bacterium]
MNELDLLQDGARSLLSIHLSASQLEAFRWYRDELLAWNERYNLTAITDPFLIESKHFLDSLTCLLAFKPADERLIDVGTGAGFPGLPLKLVCPQIQLTLVEATEKKVQFCRHVVAALGLENVDVLHARVEELGQDDHYRGRFQIALARAVAPMPVLLEYLLPLLPMGGRVVAQKGEMAPVETQSAAQALKILGGRVSKLVPVDLPRVAERRYLVVVDKISETPQKYPRRAGIPAKRPL